MFNIKKGMEIALNSMWTFNHNHLLVTPSSWRKLELNSKLVD